MRLGSGIFLARLHSAGLLLVGSLDAAQLQGASLLSYGFHGPLLHGLPVDGRKDWVFVEGRGSPDGRLLPQLRDLIGSSLTWRFGRADPQFLAAWRLAGNSWRRRGWCAAGAPLWALGFVQTWPSPALGGFGPYDVHAGRVRLPNEAVSCCANNRAAFRGNIHRGFCGHCFSRFSLLSSIRRRRRRAPSGW